MKHTKSIFETYGETPIKGVPTPRRCIDRAVGEEDVPETDITQDDLTGGAGSNDIAHCMDPEFADDMYSLMVSIRVMLVALVVMKLIGLISKK